MYASYKLKLHSCYFFMFHWNNLIINIHDFVSYITYNTYFSQPLRHYILIQISDKDLYTIDALPICDHAIDICLKDVHCHEKFEDFKKKCKTRDRKCVSENR